MGNNLKGEMLAAMSASLATKQQFLPGAFARRGFQKILLCYPKVGFFKAQSSTLASRHQTRVAHSLRVHNNIICNELMNLRRKEVKNEISRSSA